MRVFFEDGELERIERDSQSVLHFVLKQQGTDMATNRPILFIDAQVTVTHVPKYVEEAVRKLFHGNP